MDKDATHLSATKPQSATPHSELDCNEAERLAAQGWVPGICVGFWAAPTPLNIMTSISHEPRAPRLIAPVRTWTFSVRPLESE
jgi:hypothetical protein